MRGNFFDCVNAYLALLDKIYEIRGIKATHIRIFLMRLNNFGGFCWKETECLYKNHSVE